MSMPECIADLDPAMAAIPAADWTASQIEGLLIQAVYRQRAALVARALQALPAGRIPAASLRLADQVVSACDAIRRWNRSEGDRLVRLLSEGGVPAAVAGTQETGGVSQTHQIALTIEPGHLGQALSIAQDDGFLVPACWCGGALESLVRTRTRATLTKTDQVTTRLTLRWRDGESRGWAGRLRPADADYAQLRLPAALWPIYHLVKIMRISTRRWSGARTERDWGPFLGTPTALIPALLDAVAVGEQDRVVDLGCGDGRIVRAAARRFGCRAHGVEQDPHLVAIAQSQAAAESLQELASMECGEMTRLDLHPYSVVFLFLPMGMVAEHLPGIREQLAPGSRIIMHEQVPLAPGLQPTRSMLLTAESALTVAHLWNTAGPA